MIARADRALSVRREIARQHSEILRLIPALFEATLERRKEIARYQVTWEHVANTAIELRCLCAELEGLEATP